MAEVGFFIFPRHSSHLPEGDERELEQLVWGLQDIKFAEREKHHDGSDVTCARIGSAAAAAKFIVEQR